MFKLSIPALFFAILVSANPSFSSQNNGDLLKKCLEAAEEKQERCLKEAKEGMETLEVSGDTYIQRQHYLRMLNGGCKELYESDVEKCHKIHG